MTKNKKIAAFVIIGLLIAVGVSYFAIKSAIEKIINDQETRSEIAKVVEDGLRNIVIRPKVSIQSLKFSGLSQVDIGQSSLSAAGRPLLNGIGHVRCSAVRLLISGSCNAELFLDFGTDGSLRLSSVVPRALIEQRETPSPMHISGSVTDFNSSVLAGEKAAGKAVVEINGGRISGTLSINVKGGREALVSGRFNGTLTKVSLGANVMGHTRKANIDVPLAIGFDHKRLFFETPLRANLFGIVIEYSGDMRFEREPVWSGIVRAKGQSPLKNYIPNIFRCKSKPSSPVNFRIAGPISNPQCR